MRGVIFARFLASAKFSLCIDYQFYNTDLNCEVLYDGYLFSCVTVGNILLDGLHRRLILNNLTLSVTDDGNYDEGYTKQSLPPSLVPPEVSLSLYPTPHSLPKHTTGALEVSLSPTPSYPHTTGAPRGKPDTPQPILPTHHYSPRGKSEPHPVIPTHHYSPRGKPEPQPHAAG